jgi:anti-sigma factor RsiW
VGEPRGGGHASGTQLSAFLDDELGDEAALTLARHVAGCGWCRHELEALRATRTALRGLPAIQAPVLTREIRSHRRVRRWSRGVVAAVGLSASALALGAAAYVAGGEGGEVVPPVELFLLDHQARTGDGPMPAPLGGPSR